MSVEQKKAWKAVRRFFFILTLLSLIFLFALWKVENQRLERFRYALIDEILPNTNFLLKPLKITYQIVSDFKSYAQLYQQNQDLKQELQKMIGWKESALQLEQKNAQLSVLNNVKLDPTINWVTGQIIADSGSPFNQSVLLNIGSNDGVKDGSATMSGLGLVGRIAGVGRKTSRVVLITDVSSSIPVIVKKANQKGLVIGDNSPYPTLNFLGNSRTIMPGMRVVTSGEGKVFPPELLIGTIVLNNSGKLKVSLAAELKEISYLRVLFKNNDQSLDNSGILILE